MYVCVRAQGAPPHYHCDSVNTLIGGRKRWLLLPPAQALYTNLHPLDWLKEHFNESLANKLISSSESDIDAQWSREDFESMLEDAALDKRMSVCDQVEGDMFYIPAFYGHATINTRESIGLAYEFDRGDC